MENELTKIFGLRAIIEAINSGKEIEKVYLQKEIKSDLANKLNRLIKNKNISSSFVPVEKLNNLSRSNDKRSQNHQGAVAKISSISFTEMEELIDKVMSNDKIPLALLLDQITDVRNMGTILLTVY